MPCFLRLMSTRTSQTRKSFSFCFFYFNKIAYSEVLIGRPITDYSIPCIFLIIKGNVFHGYCYRKNVSTSSSKTMPLHIKDEDRCFITIWKKMASLGD